MRLFSLFRHGTVTPCRTASICRVSDRCTACSRTKLVTAAVCSSERQHERVRSRRNPGDLGGWLYHPRGRLTSRNCSWRGMPWQPSNCQLWMKAARLTCKHQKLLVAGT